MTTEMQQRLQTLCLECKRSEFDAVVLASAEALGYFFGLFEHSHERFMAMLVRANGDFAFICPSLTSSQARRCGITTIKDWSDGQNPYQLFEELCDDWDIRTGLIGIEESLGSGHLLQMQTVVPGARYVGAGELISVPMRAKSDQEIAYLKAAGAIVDDVFEWSLNHLKPGMTEIQIQGMLQSEILIRGAGLNFCIVAAGPGSAEPHHLTGNAKTIQDQPLLIDFGCTLEHYHADITRMVYFGEPSEEYLAVHEAVYGAHMASYKLVAPGILASEVDRAGRAIIEDAGYGEYFVHRTGHGIGLHGHEAPYISSNNATPLFNGDCFSIEPGIYLEGKFGIRLENIVACGVAGHDVVSLNREILSKPIKL